MAAQADDGDEVVLHHTPRTRSSVVRWMLEEVGCPYRVRPVNLEAGEQKSPEFLALNPMGKVPVLQHRGVVVTETSAICCYLADAFPQAELAPATDAPERGPYLRWLFFAPGCLEPAMADRSFKRDPGPEGQLGYGTFAAVLAALETALAPGPHILGERFSAVDVVIGSYLRWGRMTGTIPEQPAIAGYLDRLGGRPALQRAMGLDS